MKITCALPDFNFGTIDSDLNVVLYGHVNNPAFGSAGIAVLKEIVRKKLLPAPKAWDLLSLALAVVSADLAGHRKKSPDGWTREFDLTVSVVDSRFWNDHAVMVEKLLQFLTTDIWRVQFIDGGILPRPNCPPTLPEEDCAVLLSGGLDSYIGTLDLVSAGKKPFAVSQTVRGDAKKQTSFAAEIGGGLRHFQVNHNAKVPNSESPASQRGRSIIFLAYGVLVATTLARYHSGEEITLYVCENGFIAINPPLTGGRLGSLSTRTTHPVVLSLLQQLLDAAGLRVRLVNPYQFKTKGEMLRECADQNTLKAHASNTTSCGRFKQYGYCHCGRCIPCLIRRAAFYAWKEKDSTRYKYNNLAINDNDHAGFDDVRSALIGITECGELGIARWLGATLSSGLVTDKEELKQTVERGLLEVRTLLNALGVK